MAKTNSSTVAGKPGIANLTRPIRAAARSAVFFLKVFPMLPSRPVDWVTPTPLIETVCYPTHDGTAQGEVYRPPGPGPHPGIVVCLGVVPFGVDHPQVAVLGKALARAGLAALLYWSPSMRDFRLNPVDIENISLAYDWLISQPYVDAARSGLLGTCVGGSFALMASANALIRERVAYASAYAPYTSIWTFGRDIASASVESAGGRTAWNVDQLTRRVFVYSLTATLKPDEAERMRAALSVVGGQMDGEGLSPEGRAVHALLSAPDAETAEEAIRGLPDCVMNELGNISPLDFALDIRAPLIVLLHDRGDQVIPVGETRRLVAALDGRSGVKYTEMQFQHLDPQKAKMPVTVLMRELGKFFRAVYPIFRQTVR